MASRRRVLRIWLSSHARDHGFGKVLGSMNDNPDVLRAAPRRLSLDANVAAASAVIGGALCIAYGLLTMLHPMGPDVVYSAAQGYSVVVASPVFVAYGLPGSLALILTAVALFGTMAQLRRSNRGWQRTSRGLAYAALGLGVISCGGVALLVDPVFTAGRIFGTLALGAATVGAAVGARLGNAEPA